MLDFIYSKTDLSNRESWMAKHDSYLFVVHYEPNGKYVAFVGDERDYDLLEWDGRPAPVIIGRDFSSGLEALNACQEFASKLHSMAGVDWNDVLLAEREAA